MFFDARSIQYWSSLRSTNILSYLLFSIFFILSNASPQKHLTEFFFVALSPTFARCFSQTLTTCGSNSNQSINPKFLEIHSLATPPSPPPIMAALSLFLFRFNPDLTKVELYTCSSFSATCISLSIKRALPNCSKFKIYICWPTFEVKFSNTSFTI